MGECSICERDARGGEHAEDCPYHEDNESPIKSKNPEGFNEGHITEGCDRCHTINIMLDELLTDHPAVVKAGQNLEIQRIMQRVAAVYQKIGALDNKPKHGDFIGISNVRFYFDPRVLPHVKIGDKFEANNTLCIRDKEFSAKVCR